MRPTNKDLRAMYGQTPDSFSSAMNSALQAALIPDEKEARPVKRKLIRMPLLAALILAAMLAVAYAAGVIPGRIPGVIDYCNGYHGFSAMRVTDTTAEMMAVEDAAPVTVGPVTFTLTEALCDDKTLLATWNARLTDGTRAIFIWPGDLPNEPMPSDLREFYGIKEPATYSAAAKSLGLPLYDVSAYTCSEGGSGMWTGEQIRSINGSIGIICLEDVSKAAKHGETELNVVMDYIVTEYDPNTGKPIEDHLWRCGEETTMPVQPVIATRSYLPRENASLGEWFTVDEVAAEQTCMGVYVSARLTLKPGMNVNQFHTAFACNHLEWLSKDGDRLPFGIGSLWNDWNWAEQNGKGVMRRMLGLNELPETLTLCLVQDRCNEMETIAQRVILQ